MGSSEGHNQKANRAGGVYCPPSPRALQGVPGPPCPAATLSGQEVPCIPARAPEADGHSMGFVLPPCLPAAKQEAEQPRGIPVIQCTHHTPPGVCVPGGGAPRAPLDPAGDDGRRA